MKVVWLSLSGLVIAGIGYALGALASSPRSPPPSSSSSSSISPTTINEALDASFYGTSPNWIGTSGEGALFTKVRRRAYEFCFRQQIIDKECVKEQDEAVRDTVAALDVATAQQNMHNKESLGLKERWVAEHPEVTTRIRAYCWNLYKVHGATDARLLAVCFGNLTDFSPLVPLPVL